MDDRFTPEEIKLLIESGDLTMEDIGILHPDDREVFAFELAKSGQGPEVMGSPVASMGATIGAKLPGMIQKGASMFGGGSGLGAKVWNSAAPLAAEIGTFGALSASGAPDWLKYFASRGVGRGIPKMGGGGKLPPSGPPNLSNEGRGTFQDSLNRAKGGVQNDFKGQVGFNNKPDPPNLIRQGNLTSPGPGAKPGPASPTAKMRKPTDNFEKKEFPSGTNSKTAPRKYIERSNADANKQVPDKDVSKVRRRIKKDLDK